MMSLGVSERLKAARERKDLSIQALADKTMLSPIDIAELEAGHDLRLLNWKLVKALRLAVALDLKLAEILGESTENNREETLEYNEWALILSALIEYSANRPGLRMEDHIFALIEKVKTVAGEKRPQ